VPLFGAAALLIAVNWGVYVYAELGHVVRRLGVLHHPLVTVMLA
jgi:EamA domain-containing membrane protein RarD